MRISAVLVAVLTLAVVPVAVSAQSLADAAREEQARRKEVKGPSDKVFTNKDLKEVPPPPTPAPGDASSTTGNASGGSGDAAAAPAGASASKPAAGDASADQAGADTDKDAKVEKKDREYWHGRMVRLQASLEEERTLLDAMQSRINSLTSDFTSRDDPAQRSKIGKDRDKALSEQTRLQKAVQADTKAIAALEEEARRAGVPPGWLR